jgi:SnoaL-like protein
MIEDLPKPIALYISAENTGDATLFDQAFAENAVVRDENETHSGLAAIKQWKVETKKKYQHSVDPLNVIERDGAFVVTNKLTGNFSGSPIELEFAFTIKDDKIVSLEILS